MRRALVLTILFLGIGASALMISELPKRVGPQGDHFVQADGSITQGEGDLLTLHSKPVDICVSPSGKWVAVKDNGGVSLLDSASFKQVGRWSSKDGMSAVGLQFRSDDRLYSTTSGKYLVELAVASNGAVSQTQLIDLGSSYPNGLALHGDHAYVALSSKNEVVEVNLTDGHVQKTFRTGIAPFSMTLSSDGATLYVTEQGGMTPSQGSDSAPSAGTSVAVKENGTLKAAALAEIDLEHGVVIEYPIPTLPTGIVFDRAHHLVIVTCANADTLVTFDPRSKTVRAQHEGDTPLSWMPTGACIIGKSLAIASAATNRINFFEFKNGWKRTEASLRTDWYPIALASAGGEIYVANAKGLGSRTSQKQHAYNSYDYTGSIRRVKYQDRTDQGKVDQPSVDSVPKNRIKHVVYVIKENRTYDQVYGDMIEGDGDPNLCQFGEKITPNQHALAREFILFDNYYCSGVLSADGHSWATEGNSTPYLERSFGGFKRSYTFGNDPITYSSSGFIWDPFVESGLSFRNFGEFDTATPAKPITGTALYAASLSGEKLDLTQDIGVKRVYDHTIHDYPGWNLNITDQYRMDRFLEDFEQQKAAHQMPTLTTVYLPNDHTGGPASPQAMVADNDLAVGRLVEAISHSEFWTDTVIFVAEDDPQAGTDHVDGHRSGILVVGPWIKRNTVGHAFHTQASILHTITDLFGFKPLNYKSSIAPSFAEAFESIPNTKPFDAIKNSIPLAEARPGGEYAKLMKGIDLSDHEVENVRDMEAMNRAIWVATRPGERYPVEATGAHSPLPVLRR